MYIHPQHQSWAPIKGTHSAETGRVISRFEKSGIVRDKRIWKCVDASTRIWLGKVEVSDFHPLFFLPLSRVSPISDRSMDIIFCSLGETLTDRCCERTGGIWTGLWLPRSLGVDCISNDDQCHSLTRAMAIIRLKRPSRSLRGVYIILERRCREYGTTWVEITTSFTIWEYCFGLEKTYCFLFLTSRRLSRNSNSKKMIAVGKTSSERDVRDPN